MRAGSRLWTLLSVPFFLLACGDCIPALANTSASVTPEFQSKIVELFSRGKCDEILRRTDPDKVRVLRPNVMAIVAYCDPPWESAESIFAMAEKLSPTGDLILVLHAKYRTKKDHDSAAPIWNRVLLMARNPAFRDMAEAYFSGEPDEGRPINLSPVTVFGSVMIGAGQESNPRPEELSYLPTHGSAAIFTDASFTWRRWFHWGSIATDYDISYSDFFSESQYTLMDQTLNIPFAIHLSSSKDIVFNPIVGTSRIGGDLYQTQYGIKVSGVVYKSTYRQSVEGSVSQDNYHIRAIENESAAQYRFQYSWEFFPKLTYLSALLRIEHDSASSTSDFNGISGYFPFSHTDLGVQFKTERNYHGLLFGVAPSFAYRFDSEESSFPLNTTGEVVAKRRVDKILGVQPSVSIPFNPMVALYVWYRYDRIFSNIGARDYVNYNLTDNTVGAAIKASLSSY